MDGFALGLFLEFCILHVRTRFKDLKKDNIIQIKYREQIFSCL